MRRALANLATCGIDTWIGTTNPNTLSPSTSTQPNLRGTDAESGGTSGAARFQGRIVTRCGVARALSASPTANPVGAEEERGKWPVSFTKSTAASALARVHAVSPRVDLLASNELQLLADKSLELADRYERDAEFMDDKEGRQIALTLSSWRRDRGRYFRELSATAERVEATRIGWARACLRGPNRAST